MTLDISKFIANAIRTQSKISHLDINAKAVKKNSIPKSVSSIITDKYGDTYLDDAEYVAFFWGPISKDNIDKLFNVVDKALGKSANMLTDKDFKKITIDADEETETEEVEDTEEVDVEDSEDVEANDSDEEAETEEVEEQLNEDDESEDESDNDDSNDESDEEDDEEAEETEDDEEVEVEEVKEEKTIPTSYFFLKITTK